MGWLHRLHRARGGSPLWVGALVITALAGCGGDADDGRDGAARDRPPATTPELSSDGDDPAERPQGGPAGASPTRGTGPSPPTGPEVPQGGPPASPRDEPDSSAGPESPQGGPLQRRVPPTEAGPESPQGGPPALRAPPSEAQPEDP